MIRRRHGRALTILVVTLTLLAGACGINADDRPRPIAPKETTTTTR